MTTARLEMLVSATAVLFIASMAALIQSFVLVKLSLLSLFLLASLALMIRRGTLLQHRRLIAFYLAIAILGTIWAVVGMFRGANHVTGILDAVRLYVVWSMAFLLLYTLLRATRSGGLRELHLALVVAGIVISLINLFGLLDMLLGLGVVTEAVRKELDMYIGIHTGYVQITSQNIGALFLIVPYLVALQFRTDAAPMNTRLARLSLLLCLLLTALSGRRALWLTVALTPAIVFAMSIMTGGFGFIGRWSRRALLAYGVAGAVATALLFAPADVPVPGYMVHLRSAFSAQDERVVQRPSLMRGFSEASFVGTGFGAAASYVRTPERPWRYELTYHQMLFNLGLTGFALLAGLFCWYLVLDVLALRSGRGVTNVPFALLVAVSSLLMGAVSNPYTGSFDFLFFVGLLPFLSTFPHGYPSAARVRAHAAR